MIEPSPRMLADMELLDDLKAQYQAMIGAIASDQTSLADANWNTLTTAAKAETLRGIEQHLLIGTRRILRALAVYVLYARGDG